ncbi:hypothetical protein KC19_12G029900 [Ceratodon purpureus]|uniref:Uncharacterized protein n=1 Tax=Ceratodon purpureus TaxID=3225 RepID=A0A8T0G3K2_CERPU|nr:hypothetical protein KC19_12G029900 [Ceratodon purpureus]
MQASRSQHSVHSSRRYSSARSNCSPRSEARCSGSTPSCSDSPTAPSPQTRCTLHRQALLSSDPPHPHLPPRRRSALAATNPAYQETIPLPPHLDLAHHLAPSASRSPARLHHRQTPCHRLPSHPRPGSRSPHRNPPLRCSEGCPTAAHLPTPQPMIQTAAAETQAPHRNHHCPADPRHSPQECSRFQPASQTAVASRSEEHSLTPSCCSAHHLRCCCSPRPWTAQN